MRGWINLVAMKTQFEKLKERVAKRFPETPGVYTMYGTPLRLPGMRSGTLRRSSREASEAKGKILYIGKAGNLRRRVSSYFLKAHDARIERLMQEVREITYEETDTALEALILESKRIKEHHPVYNILEQDDKSFLHVAITTREEFPRVLLVRGKDLSSSKTFGPFTSASSIREALRILRRIFPWHIHRLEGGKVGRLQEHSRPCFDYEVGLCPGTCVGAVDKAEYRKNVRRLVSIFEGKKSKVVRELEREMEKASRALEFEKAVKLRKQIFALKHIQDIALIGEPEFPKTYNLQPKTYARIEGYDISNISGTSAVGSMVVFVNGAPDKNEYRKFKIRTTVQPDDVGMLKEVLRRRFKNSWQLPSLILIDGGRGQVNAAKEVLGEANLQIPIVGIAKGPERKKNDIIGKVPACVSLATLIRVRDEAHRFAIAYHKKLRRKRFLE